MFCQTDTTQSNISLTKVAIDTIDFALVDVKPYFQGGDAEMVKYISQNLNFSNISIPKEELLQYSTKVFIIYVIDENEKVINVRPVETSNIKAHPSVVTEAIRVVSQMPDWTAGKHNGDNVNVRMIIPLHIDFN